MSTTLDIVEIDPLVIHFGAILRKLDAQDFYEFCMANKDLRIERSKEGDLIIMPPTGGKTGIRNFELITQFGMWVKADGTGQGFDSSTEFNLPNGAYRSPDFSWIRNERWYALTEEEQERFPPICPDFVVELRSRTDRLKNLKAKMQEYMENGAELGWLIDPSEKKVYVYRLQVEVEVLDNPQSVSGEPLLKGFVLDVQSLWD